MELRTCKTCGVEKELTENNYIKTDGGKYWAKECKDCKNEKRRAKRAKEKGKEYKPAKSIVSNIKLAETENIKPERTYKSMNIFNESEIEILKKIISEYTTTTNKNIELEKTDRIRKTYNIEKVLSKKILQEARKQGLTSSDILNVAVKKYFFDV